MPPLDDRAEGRESAIDTLDAADSQRLACSVRSGGQRYITIRASNLAFGFHKTVHAIYGDAEQAMNVCNGLLFDLARTMGEEDARLLCDKLGLRDPMARLMAGPEHFERTGMATVRMDPRSKPTLDEHFLLLYQHDQSFEADSWVEEGRASQQPVCIMGCGYSSGWASVALGLPLAAVEYSCRARGDDACRFLMAHSAHVRERLVELVGAEVTARLHVPRFFGRKDEEASLRAMALTDSLTGLANRAALHARLVMAIDAAGRVAEHVCLLFIDLDGFKQINDSHGHDAGDEALKVTATRLQGAVRSNDVVARLGGDEFAVLLPGVGDIGNAEGVAAKLVNLVHEPFDYRGHSLRVGASIGVGACAGDGMDADGLVADADGAMYAAKRAGKYQYKLSDNAQRLLRSAS